MQQTQLKGRIARFCVFGLLLPFLACSSEGGTGEPVDFAGLLPEGAVTEITHAYPEFAVTLVSEQEANVAATFGEMFIRIDGIEEDEARERIAGYVLQYLENPDKREEDRVAREAHDALPPVERLAALVQRIRDRNPDFDYEWTGLGEGNVEAEYGDNSLMMTGIEGDGAREEWAHAIIRIQKEIDAAGGGDIGEGR